jgi:hypothetical protein
LVGGFHARRCDRHNIGANDETRHLVKAHVIGFCVDCDTGGLVEDMDRGVRYDCPGGVAHCTLNGPGAALRESARAKQHDRDSNPECDGESLHIPITERLRPMAG